MPPLLSEGVEPVGNVVMKKAVFTVETISAGMGEVLVYVEDPAGHREEVRPWRFFGLTVAFFGLCVVPFC